MTTAKSEETKVQGAYCRQVISPPPGVALAGYFAPRYNRGVADDLFVKTLLVRHGDMTVGFVVLDLLEAPLWLCERVHLRLRESGLAFADNLIISATHTHTGPEPRRSRDDVHQAALEHIADNTVAAVRMAAQRFTAMTLRQVQVTENPYAFNRRYWMADGGVLTNPGKQNPDIVEPEGSVDRQIDVLLLEQDNQPVAMLANLVNHTDTVGGDLVSADWPGFLERRIQQALGRQVPVLTLIGAAGNINHFDVSDNDPQTSYDEARRIGEGYAEIVLRVLPAAKAVDIAPFSANRTTFEMHRREVSDEELAQANALLAQGSEQSTVFTSEDLAKGAPGVLRYFARQKVQYAENEAGRRVDFPIRAFRLGRDLAVVSLPGEPFTEIGMAVKDASPFAQTLVVSNAEGYAGYIVPEECFDRGGYEPLPVEHGGGDRTSANALIQAALEALRGL